MANDGWIRVGSGALLLALIVTSGFYRARAERKGGLLPARPDGLPATSVRVAIGIAVWAALLLPILAPSTVGWISAPLPSVLRLAGLGLLGGAGLLLWWTLASIGDNISPSTSTRAGARLVTEGPYRFVRHPLYTGGFLAMLGIGLANQSIPLLAAVPILLWWLPRRVRDEERNLTASYGDAYRAYQTRTGRFLPRLARQQ
ncbi:MAG: methyltransferase family protein [Gemmatimonadales bacterium]